MAITRFQTYLNEAEEQEEKKKKKVQSFREWAAQQEEEKPKEEGPKAVTPGKVQSFRQWASDNGQAPAVQPTNEPTISDEPEPPKRSIFQTGIEAVDKAKSAVEEARTKRAEEEPQKSNDIGRYRPKELAPLRKISPDELSPDEVVSPLDSLYNNGTIDRAKTLAAKGTLSADEKKEAREIQKEIDRVTRTSGVQKSDKYGELTDLNAKLYSKSNWLAGVGAGAISALGFDWLTDRTADLISAITGVESGTGAQELVESAQKNNPFPYAAGNVVGNLVQIGAISGAVGKALQGAEWFTKLAPWVQKAASSAITFGISGAASGIANTQTKKEWDERERQQQILAEDFGASYTPREYSVGQQLGNVGISAATGIASGGLGGLLGSAFGAGTSNILVRNGLQYNNALRAIAAGINGVGFSIGSTAAQEMSKYLQYPEGYNPDAREIGTNLAVAFLFSTVSSVLGEAKSAKANKEALLKMMDELAVEYETAKIKMAGMTGDARIAEAQKALALSQRIRTSLATSPGMSGVQNEVKALAAALDIIDDQMGAIAAGGNGLLGASDIFSEAGSSVGEPLALAVQRIGANVPAPTGSAPQTQTIIPTTPQQAQTFPAWYQAYQNSPRPVDMPARQQPTLQLPTPPTPAQTQQGNVDTAPALPVPLNAPQAPVAAETKRPPEPPAGLVLPTNNAPQELTSAQDTGIVEENPVERAKQEIRNAIKMPIQGTNEQALARGAETGELTMDSVTIGGKVKGFTKEQQTSFARQVIEGTQNGEKEIAVKVPDDGSFEITNSPEAVAQVLNELHVKANQESVYTQQVDRWLRGAKRVRIATIGGEKYVTDGILVYPVGDVGAEFAKTDPQGYKAEDLNLNEETANMLRRFADTGTVVTKQPYVGKLGKSGQVYIFDTPDGRLVYSKRLFDLIDTGTLKYGMMEMRGKQYPIAVTVNSDGSIAGVLYPIHNSDVNGVDLRQFTTAKLQSVVPDHIGGNNAEGITQAPDAHGPQKTPEAQLSSLPSAEKRVTNPGDTVNAPVLPTAKETLSPAPKELTLPEAAQPSKSTKPHEALAESIRRELEEGNTITSQQLQELAEKAFGGTRGSGAYDIKTAYDAMELAVNQYLMDSDFVKQGNGDAAAAVRTEKGLQQVLSQLPTQSVRTEEQQQYQQFSTPPNIAYLAAWAANIDSADSVLEPSAGIGGLALWPKAWGATVYGNEYSPRRAEILRSLGLDEVFVENAEQINNVLPDYVKPTVVLMNPPFSATAGRLSSNNTANAKRHIEQALDRLEDGGRLVAILWRGMSDDSKTFASWWNDLRKEYNIRANLSIDGRNYHKYGTDFDVQMVVIDKTGPQTGETITGAYTDLTEIPSVLEGIRNDRTQIERQPANASGRSISAHDGPERTGVDRGGHSGSPERAAGGTLRDGGSAAPVLPGNGGRVQPSGTGENGLRLGGDTSGKRVGGESGGTPAGVPDKSEPERIGRSEPELSVRGLTLPGPEPTAENPIPKAKPSAASKQKAGNDDNVFAEYIPPKTPVKGAKKHPAKLVESAAMAAVDAPTATYTPNIPKELISSGALSNVQLTNIVYAGQAHSQMIPNQNKRKGYFIGDGTGVGKGRQLAGIILDNFRQGRTKAVWISKGQNLYPDAKRDWTAMGMDPNEVYTTQKIKADAPIKAGRGVLFTTYDTLANKSKSGKSRLDQIVDWLGEDFDGVICFDEAHTMGNLLGKQSKRGNSKPAERAIAGAALQNRLPNARIVYASATMATDVSEMAFAERLGLWGPGTQFNNVRDFVSKISDGGMAAMELVARDMKAMGVYQARSISYDGVEYETLQHDLSPMQKEIYNTMSRAWQITLQNMNKALEMTGANLNGNAKGKAKSAYYGALQRFYNQILTSMAVPSVIKDMKKELANGRSIVIQIVNTNEAETERQLAKAKESGESLDDLDITPRENLVGYLRNSFPVQVYEEVEDENGNKRSVPVTDSNGNPVLDKKAIAMRDKLIAEIEEMSVPEGPLEMIYDAFGTENVAEVTGRGRRIVPGKDEYGNTVKVEEKRSPKSGEADATAFQDGKKRILIFSDAGGTGKSYHADLTAQNQQQRVHYLLQPGWSAPKAVQGFGRTHRSNEASAPIYKLVTTDVKGQKRFVSTIARRLDQLGALTKGQRQTGSGMFSARDNLESDLATDSLYNFYRALVGGQIEGLEASDVLDKLGLTDKFTDKESGQIKVPDSAGRDMSLFLNRILALEYDEQNLVFDAFSRIFDDAYETALANGTLDMGMETVRADKIDILDDMVVREDPNSGAATNYVQAKLSEKARIVRTIDDLKALRGDFIGLYKKKNGDVVGVFRTKDKTEADGSVVKQYILQTPQERKISRYVEKTLKNECERIPEKQWKTAWAAEVEKAPEYIETVKHMLTGSLLPIWNRLPKSGNVRVQRLIADDGRQYLGRIINADQIDGVLKSLGVTQGRTKQTYTADDVIKRVFKGGDKATLEENQVSLTRRRVGNEWRIEITGSNLWYLKRQIPAIIEEYINYSRRYFVPNGAEQKPTIEAILAQNPVRDIESVRGEVEDSREASNFNGNNAPRHPENWTTTRVGDQNKKPMSGPDIVEMIRHDFDIPISTGNIRSANARAQYRNQPQTVRSKVANSIPDIAHELGHHLDNVFDIRNNISASAKQEIIDAMPDSFKKQYKKEQLPGEGIAEYLRRYLQNSETAAIDYPKFTEEFFGMLDEKTRAAVDKLADEVNAYYSLSEQTGNWPVHNREDKGRDYRSFGEKLKDMNTHFRTLFIDSMEPIKQLDNETGGKAHLFATNAAYAGNRAYAAITGDLYDLRANKLGVGLQKALEGIRLNNKKEYTDFGMYLICRHGPERLAEGMRVFNDDAWDNTAWMQQTEQDLAEKYPAFEEAAERLEEYQHELIQAYGVESGLYSQETIDQWMDRWEHYVPFNRWIGDRKAKGQKQGFANQSGPYRKARGSGLDIINPVDNIIENTVRLITASIRNEVMQEITKAAARMEGSGAWLEKVPMPLAKKTWDGKGLKAQTLEEFDDYFTSAGLSLGEDGLDLIQRILDGAIDDLLVQYTRGKAHGDIVTVMKDGKPEYWKINDPDLLLSVTNMGPTRAGELLNYYGRVTRFITGNITGMNIVWSIASNSPRDIGTLFTFSKTKNIVKLLSGIGSSYVNRLKGDKASELYKEYMAMGGNSTSAQTADKDMAKKARKALQKQKSDWLNPLEWVEYISDMIESGPRYSYYKICRTKYNMSPEEAFYAAMEITTNFKRSGVLGKEINILVPFFNASIQGVDRMARWIAAEDIPKENRKAGRARRIAAYIGASLALATLSMVLNARNKKKQHDLKELSNYTKNNYFVIQMKDGKYIAIPKPRELALPTSLFERIMEKYVADNPNAFDDFWEYATDNFLPGVVSGIAQGDLNSAIGDLGALGTVHYLVSNQDFLGRPIVSGALENLEPYDQYDKNTSKLAWIIGQAFNLSPKQIDFLGKNLLGGFYQWQQALLPVGGEPDLSLGVASKWVKDPLYSTDITNRMYDRRDKLERMKNSHPGDMEIATEYRTVKDMATFYGRYYSLAKTEEETPHSREIREAVLDMIMGIEQNANKDPAYAFMLGVIEHEGSTECMPTVLDTTLKGDNHFYSLNSEEYFMLQTRYNSLYYNYIRKARDNKPKMTGEEKTATVEQAKKIAGIVARGEAIEAHGGTYEAYTKVKDLLEDGIEEGDLINYLSARDLADTDGSGKISNAEAMTAAAGLKLPTAETARLLSYNSETESLGLKLSTVSPYGVDATEYGQVLEAIGKNNVTQDNVQAAVDAVYGPTTTNNQKEKAAMWQVFNKGWGYKNNPYDSNTGKSVKQALELPTVESKNTEVQSGLVLPTK